MNKPIIIFKALILLFSLLGLTLQAQSLTDSVKLTSAERFAIGAFNSAIGKQSRLYNGPQYNYYAGNIKSNAYYKDNSSFRAATVVFDGFTFRNVPVLYDLYKDLLIAQYPDKGAVYILASNKVSAFEIDGHAFKYMSADSLNKNAAPGFYEVINTGRISALANHKKTLQASPAGSSAESYFTKESVNYFIEKDGALNAVRSEGDIVKTLKDHKKELQQYIKANKIRYKKDPAVSLEKIVSFYNQLNN